MSTELMPKGGGGSQCTSALRTARVHGWPTSAPQECVRRPAPQDLRMPGAGGALGGGFFCSRELSRRHPIAGIPDTGGQLILSLSSGLLSQLPVLGCGPCTANPRCMPGPLPLIGSDVCAGLEGL